MRTPRGWRFASAGPNGAFWMEIVNDGVDSPRRPAGMGLRLAALEALQSNGVVEFGEREPGPGRSGSSSPTTMRNDAERSPERLRVLVVDDHDVVHWGFRLMLTQQPWVERLRQRSHRSRGGDDG